MTDKDWWTTFEKTGSVVDYLSYKGIRRESETGEKSSESGSNSDGNDTVRDTYR